MTGNGVIAPDDPTLADGESDRFTVEMTVECASARRTRPGLTVRVAWREYGGDFNDTRIRLVRERERA